MLVSAGLVSVVGAVPVSVVSGVVAVVPYSDVVWSTGSVLVSAGVVSVAGAVPVSVV